MMRKFLITTIITLAVIVLGGFTYAFYEWDSTDTDVSIAVDGLRVIYDGGTSVTDVNLIPTATKEEGVLKSISVSLDENVIINPAPSMDLFLDLTLFPSTLANSSFKWEVYKDNVLLNNGDFSSRQQGDSIKILNARTITNVLDTYDIYLWIDGNMDNDSNMQSQTFEFNIHATGINALLAEATSISLTKLFDYGNFDLYGMTNSYDSNNVRNGYVLGGYKNRGTGYKVDGVISRYDLSGNQQWSQYIGDTGDDFFHTVTSSYDNTGNIDGYIIVGSISSEASMVKYDLNGTQVWQKKYFTNNMSSFDDIIPSVNTAGNIDGYIVAGYADLNDIRSAIIVKYDLNGNQVWVDDVGRSNGFCFFNKVLLSHDAAGNIDGYVVSGYGEIIDYYDGLIAKYDLSGNQLWLSNYDNDNEEKFHDSTLSYDSNGNVDGYIAVGEAPFYEYSDDGSIEEYYGLIVKYDLSGNEVWNKVYNGDAYDYFYGIAPLHADNDKVIGYAVINQNYDIDWNQRNVMVIYDLSGNVINNINLDDIDNGYTGKLFLYDNEYVFGMNEFLEY